MSEIEVSLIENYCEKLVLNAIKEHLGEEIDNPVYIADIACVALNELEPFYIRKTTKLHDFLSEQKQLDIARNVKEAVDNALRYVGCESDIHRKSDIFP